MISPYAVSSLYYSLQEVFSCQQFLLVDSVVNLPPQEVLKGCEIW